MTRDAFIARLRQGLAGLPEQTRADIAAALGDPDRLARELRAEAGLKRWETERNPEAAAAAVFALLGLGAIDVLVLLPILIAVVIGICLFGMMALGGFLFGAAVFIASPFHAHIGGPWASMLFGFGLMALSVANVSILTLISIGLINALVWYGRLHYRLLKPAIDPQPTQRAEVVPS